MNREVVYKKIKCIHCNMSILITVYGSTLYC